MKNIWYQFEKAVMALQMFLQEHTEKDLEDHWAIL